MTRKNTFAKEMNELKFSLNSLRKIVKLDEVEIESLKKEISRHQREMSKLKLRLDQFKVLGKPSIRKSYRVQRKPDGRIGWYAIDDESSGWEVFRTKSKRELLEILGRLGLEIGERGCSSFRKGEGWYDYHELKRKMD